MAIDGQDDRDGARQQGWLRRGSTIRKNTRWGGTTGTDMGLVIKVHHKDSDTNLSGSYPEYDIVLLASSVTIFNVPQMGVKLNEFSGDETTLTAASEAPTFQNPGNVPQEFLESDGDLVLIAFILEYAPVIIGTVNHFKANADTASWHGESSDGERRAMHHKGSSIIMQDDSSMEVALPDEKELVINIDGVQLFRVRNSGGTLTVDLGAGGEALVLGDSFKSWWDSNVAGHVHAAGLLIDSMLGPCTGSTAGAVPALPANKLSSVSSTS